MTLTLIPGELSETDCAELMSAPDNAALQAIARRVAVSLGLPDLDNYDFHGARRQLVALDRNLVPARSLED